MSALRSRIHLRVGLVAVLSLTGVMLAGLIANGVAAQGPQPQVAALALGTGFTYQGFLKQNNVAVNGSCDLQFALYDASSGGARLGVTQTVGALSIANGIFSTILNDTGAFGLNPFTGDARFLDIRARCPAGAGVYTALGRQRLTATPYALALPGLWTEQNATSPNLIGGFSGNSVTPSSSGSVIGGGGNALGPNHIDGDYDVIGGGSFNSTNDNEVVIGGGFSNTVNGHASVIGGGGNNQVTGDRSTIAGGEDNIAGDDSAVGGGIGNSADGFYSTVAGGTGNRASSDDSFVGGGYHNRAISDDSTVTGGISNTASATQATIGGGGYNTASGQAATVAGGEQNTAVGQYSTVGGGNGNHANGDHSTVSGGFNSSAYGAYGTVSGGASNHANGDESTVPGGVNNTAQGTYSFAAGRNATALYTGTFIWADSTNTNFFDTGPDQFLIRAGGGVGMGTTAPETQLHVKKSANGSGTNPADNVAVFENTNAGNSADVLALKIGGTLTPTQSNNYVTFLYGNNLSAGALQGNNAGSVELAGAGSDYAEWLPRLEADESMQPGDIVGIAGGRVTKDTREASQVMVVSTGPIVSGNDPGEAARGGYAQVAFIGQALVHVRGPVQAGDFIVPSGLNDGSGIAVAPENLSAEQLTQVVGEAWESAPGAGARSVRVAVGVTRNDLALRRLVERNDSQAKQLASLSARVDALERGANAPVPWWLIACGMIVAGLWLTRRIEIWNSL